jgi:hypothetical protein
MQAGDHIIHWETDPLFFLQIFRGLSSSFSSFEVTPNLAAERMLLSIEVSGSEVLLCYLILCRVFFPKRLISSKSGLQEAR